MIKEFLKPASLDEAVELKNKYAGSIYFGGGTEINYSGTLTRGEYVISLKNLRLKEIKVDEDLLEIGASVTIQSLIDSILVPAVLKEAALFIYSRNIRNIATIGGNIGAKKTDSALIPCLIALSAEVRTLEEGVLTVEDYITGNKESLILSISIPNPGGVCAVKKISRTVSSAAVINVAVCISGKDGNVSKAVVAVGGIDPKVIRLGSIEKKLESGDLRTRKDLEKAVSEIVSPVSDLLGTSAYKKYITGVAVADCLAD